MKYKHLESIHNTKAPEKIVPYIIQLLKPSSVLDVGCGIGTWLKVFRDFGVDDVFGIDGEYVDRGLLFKHVSSSSFKGVDLEDQFELGRKFDLVISLEVGEHLSESAATVFVDSLCSHADTIIFSAAIPGQGGQNHLNEQWPIYWFEHFRRHGFKVYDPFRKIFWNVSDIEPWYRQNLFLFSKHNLDIDKPFIPDIVLPDYWQQKVSKVDILERSIKRIREGKVGSFFYLKCFLRSLRYFGRKVS